MAKTKRPYKARETKIECDRDGPAYRIIYGVFGGLTPFCDATGIAVSTAHGWLTIGYIPETPDGRHAMIMGVAKRKGYDLPPEMFVRTAQAA